MKILIFNWRDITHPQAGGCELHLHELGRRMVEKGHNVTLFCGKYKGSKSNEIIEGIKVIRRGGKYSVYLYAIFCYISKLRKNDYDVIVDDINGIPFFSPLFTKKPKVAIIHHLTKDIFSIELPIIFRPIAYFAEWLIPIIYKKTTFITVSKSTKNEMVNFGISPNNITIIHNGISKKYTSDLINKSKNPFLLYIGRLKKYKQLDYLIMAIDLIKVKFPNVKLAIAGSGDEKENLLDLVKKFELDDYVKFYGYISEEQKIRLYRKSWIYINPSKKEGWGLTVIEANACGTPAIAFNVEGLKDSIINDNNGILVDEIDYKLLAEKIIELIKNNEYRLKLSKNAIKWSKNFNWDNSLNEFLKLLENEILKY